MSKVVTAIAALFVVGVIAVVAINHGALDMVFGEGEADVQYEIVNDNSYSVDVTFTDGINDPISIHMNENEAESMESVHYKWGNKAPMTIAPKCTVTKAGISYDVPVMPVILKSGDNIVVKIVIDLPL